MVAGGRQQLYNYIKGVLQNKNCHLYRINGVEDHLHILTHLHPSIALADLVKDVKLSSSKYIKEICLFPEFIGWQSGYGAFTYSMERKYALLNYIKNQEEHHRTKSYIEEYVELLKEHGLEFDENGDFD